MKEFLDFASSLQLAIKSGQLYTPDHPRSVEAAKAANEAMTKVLSGRERVQMVTSRGKIFIDGNPVDDKNPHVVALARQLSERSLSGFTFLRNIEPAELEQLVRILSMKPQQLDARGGAAQLLSDAGATHIRLSHVRYEEMIDGEVVVSAEAAASAGLSLNNIGISTGGGSGRAGVSDSGDVMSKIAEYLAYLVANTGNAAGGDPGLGDGGIDPKRLFATRGTIDFVPLAKKTEELGIEGGEALEGAIRQRIASLDAGEKAKLLSNADSLPGGALKKVLDEVAPDLFVDTVASLSKTAALTNESFTSAVMGMFSFLSQRSRGLDMLRNRMRDLGITKDQLEQLLEVLGWENLSREEKVQKIIETKVMFELPAEKLLGFIIELIRLKKFDDANKVVERYATGLFSESLDIRRTVTDNFVRLVSMIRDSGSSPQIEATLEKALLTQFLRESDQKIHRRCTEALEQVWLSWLSSGNVERVYQNLRKLEAPLAAIVATHPWKKDSWEAFLDRLVDGAFFAGVLNQVYTRDVEAVATTMHPMLVFFADRSARKLLETLAEEEDRAKRGRLVRAIKAVGKPALQHLGRMLESSTWYVVRNALNLLGDLVALDLLEDIARQLRHSDARVQRAAARALSKMGGPRAEKYLSEVLHDGDSETQGEILLCLAAIKAESAVGAILEIAKPKRLAGDERLRVKALETLGQIGSATAIGPLAEILKRKSRLAGQESAEIRFHAAKALLQIGTPEARSIVEKVVESEPQGSTRDALEKAWNEGA